MSSDTKRSASGTCAFAHSLNKIVKESNSFYQPSVSCLVKLISITRNLTSGFSGVFSGSFHVQLVMLEVACSCHGPGSGQGEPVLNLALRNVLWTCLWSWVLVLATAEAIKSSIQSHLYLMTQNYVTCPHSFWVREKFHDKIVCCYYLSALWEAGSACNLYQRIEFILYIKLYEPFFKFM